MAEMQKKIDAAKAKYAASEEEMQAYAVAHPEHGPWPSALPSKDAAFAKLVAQLQKTGVTTVSGSAKFSETWLRDRVYHGNATGC